MSAIFSPCRTWRYVLERRWVEIQVSASSTLVPRTVLFIGLNPSTADETADDPTIRRCVGFAKRWGFGRLVVCNLFAYRATDPKELRRLTSAIEAIGLENDRHIEDEACEADLVVAAWGSNGDLHRRGEEVLDHLFWLDVPLAVLGWTKGDPPQPRHPLYLRGDTEPVPVP